MHRHVSNLAVEPHAGRRSTPTTLPIFVLSDRPLMRDLMVEYLRRHGFPQTRGETALAQLATTPRESPMLVLVDLGCHQEDPAQTLHGVRRQRPLAKVVGVGTSAQLAAHDAAGLDGWIEVSNPASSLTTMAEAVARRRALAGPPRTPLVARELRVWRGLSKRQRQVLGLIGCGVTNGRLADTLGITERSAKAHVAALLDKFKADNRTELALIACKAGLGVPRDDAA